MRLIFYELERKDNPDYDDRAVFLEQVRSLSKRLVGNAKKNIQGKMLSKKEEENQLWSFIQNRENGYRAERELRAQDVIAEKYELIPRKVKRMGHQIRLRDSRSVDLMLDSAACGMESGLKDAVTKKFERGQRKKAREAARARKADRSRQFAPPPKSMTYVKC